MHCSKHLKKNFIQPPIKIIQVTIFFFFILLFYLTVVSLFITLKLNSLINSHLSHLPAHAVAVSSSLISDRFCRPTPSPISQSVPLSLSVTLTSLSLSLPTHPKPHRRPSSPTHPKPYHLSLSARLVRGMMFDFFFLLWD